LSFNNQGVNNAIRYLHYTALDRIWSRDKCPVHRWAHVPISLKTLDNFDFTDNIYVTITNALISALYISDTETIRRQANFPPGCVVSFF
jgi:hypothetical protein